MGNFYVNYTIRGAAVADLVDALAGRRAFVTSAGGDLAVVFDEASDRQDTRVIHELAQRLSASARATVLAVMNHDDDILWYELFDRGDQVDTYNSSPDYFEVEGEPRGPTGGDAEKLCRAFGCGRAAEVERILRWGMDHAQIMELAAGADPEEGMAEMAELQAGGFTFAFERHGALVRELGLPTWAVGSSFAGLDEGELPKALRSARVERVGPAPSPDRKRRSHFNLEASMAGLGFRRHPAEVLVVQEASGSELLDLTLRVDLGTGSPVTVETRCGIPPQFQGTIQPGHALEVWIDPSNHRRLMPIWQ